MSKRRILLINTNLKANPKLATASTKLTEQQFCALVGVIYKTPAELASLPVTKQIVYLKTKEKYQVLLNRCAGLRGIQYKSHNYCTSFTVTANISYATSRNHTRNINCGVRNGNMLAGEASHRGVWTSLTKAEAANLYHGYARSNKA
jgi:hypothetical protein